jgi:WD40 repeat protein
MFSFPTIVNEFGISSCKLSENAIVTSLHVDDDLIALSLNNGTVHLLRSTGEHIAELKADDSVCLWSLAVKNKLLVAGGFDGYLQVWDLESRYAKQTLICLPSIRSKQYDLY